MQTITGSNVTIMVKNMDASISFYEQIGLTLQQRWGDNYAMISAEGITIGIHPGGTDSANSGTISIGFMIKSIEEAESMLQEAKIPYKAEKDGKSGLYLHFKDPDNTVLYFVQPMWS
jgi:predicted enzyme related to lactoylglutathione lyase